MNLENSEFWTRYVPFWHPESPVPFLETEANHFQVKSKRPAHIKSMLHTFELCVLFALAKDYWTGRGEIVDLGCLYGLTTRCFAEGLFLNDRVPEDEKRKRIYAYDLFLAEDYDWWTQESQTVHGGSLFPEFLDINMDRIDYVAPCPGNLLSMRWGHRPIEILMIDAAKSWALNHWVVSRTFPRLIPGESIVVQQDYMHHAEYWCHVTMEYFADRFRALDYVYGASCVFQCTRPITEQEAAFDLSNLPNSEQVRLMDQAIEKAPRSAAEVLKIAKAQMLMDHGDTAGARQILANIDPDQPFDRPWQDFSGIVRGCLHQMNYTP